MKCAKLLSFLLCLKKNAFKCVFYHQLRVCSSIAQRNISKEEFYYLTQLVLIYISFLLGVLAGIKTKQENILSADSNLQKLSSNLIYWTATAIWWIWLMERKATPIDSALMIVLPHLAHPNRCGEVIPDLMYLCRIENYPILKEFLFLIKTEIWLLD